MNPLAPLTLAEVTPAFQEFQVFSKIPRLNREIIISEKIDGSNAQVALLPETLADGTLMPNPYRLDWFSGPDASCWGLYAGSRNRWLTPAQDNYGFAAWVTEHKDELRALRPGRHFGEWWGHRINRGYGLTERRFSLFNVGRWDRGVWETNESARFLRETVIWDRAKEKGKELQKPELKVFVEPPACCRAVTVLFTGIFDSMQITSVLQNLQFYGSKAVPGFMDPEGIIIFHVAGGHLYKKTIKDDEKPKGDSGS